MTVTCDRGTGNRSQVTCTQGNRSQVSTELIEATKVKPLGGKSYGSIPHLPGSRLGPGDHHCHQGQADICTVKPRDRHDWIIVQEKLDGTNVGVARIDGAIIPLTRAGYVADTSPHAQHHYFHRWVMLHQSRFKEVLSEGERLCGEWMLQAHGSQYDLEHEPFYVFDLFSGNRRVPYNEFIRRLGGIFMTPQVLQMGQHSLTTEDAMTILGTNGFHGCLEQPEGAVWRVERDGAVDFLTKFVRPDKVDGKYLTTEEGSPRTVWNFGVDRFMESLR